MGGGVRLKSDTRTALVGLDVGTTGVKAIALSPDGEVLATAAHGYPLSTPQAGWAEQDPADWWTAAQAALAEVAAGREVAGIGLSGQMHGLVALDWHSGNRSVLVPLHVGIGARMLDMEGRCWNGDNWVYCDNDTWLGVRAPVGVSFLFGKVPMDLFVELALVVDLVEFDDDDRMYDHDRAGLDGVLGGRFYF